MKKTINKLLLWGIFLCSINLSAQWNWVTKSSSSNVEYGQDVSTDNSGNNYLIGSYYTSATIGSTTLAGIGSSDIYLSKTNAAGAVQWAVRAGGTLLDSGLRVVTNGSDVFITGTHRGTITFYSTNAATATVTGSSSNDECFIAKYNSSGVIQWATSFGGTGDQRAYDIDISNAQSKVFITGLSANRAFVNCYNYTGTLAWSNVSAGTCSSAIGFGIAADASGNCYSLYQITAGNFTIAGSPSYTVSGSHMAMLKFNATGNFTWGQQIGSTSSAIIEQPKDLDLDTAGNIYISGQYSGGGTNISSFTLTNGGLTDSFIAKYANSGGNAIWAKKISGTGSEYPTGQCVDQSTGAVYVAFKNVENNVSNVGGCFSFSSQTNVTDKKFYVVKYSTNGDVNWAVAPTLANWQSQSNGISTDGNKRVIVSGNLISTGTFGTITVSGAGSDGFVAKIEVEPSFNAYQICAGSSVVITPIGPAGLSFNWYATSTSTTTLATGSSYTTPALTSTTTYYVSTILPGGCEAQRVPVTVIVLPIAVVNAGPDQTICAGSCASINFTSSTGGVYVTDNTTNVTTGPFYSSPISLCPTTTTTYTFKNTPNPNYCKNADQVTITVNPSPVISSDFALTGTIPVGSSQYYIVTANVASVPAGSGFYWEISEIDSLGNVVPNTSVYNPSNWWDTSLYYTNTFPGYDVPISNFVNTTVGNGKFYLGHKYRITRGTWGPCTPFTTTSKEIYMCTGCKLVNGQSEFIVENSTYAPSFEEMLAKSQTPDFEITSTANVFPNPTTDLVNFAFDTNETGKIEIYSLDGKLVFTKDFRENKQLEVSLKDYQDGVYIARITTNGVTISKKIIKE